MLGSAWVSHFKVLRKRFFMLWARHCQVRYPVQRHVLFVRVRDFDLPRDTNLQLVFMKLSTCFLYLMYNTLSYSSLNPFCQLYSLLSVQQSGPGFDTRSGNILSFLLPLFQEGQLSVTGESMCTKYWLIA